MKKLDDLKVSDVMNKNVFLVNTAQLWADAARKMMQKDIHHLVIVDEHKNPVSVISAFDFLPLAVQRNRSLETERLAEHRPHDRLVTVKESSSVYEAVHLMQNHHTESLVVFDDSGKMTGIVTAKDLMGCILDV